MPELKQPPDVVAAGAVVTRRGKQVLLVHRPKYDDWSFPKGKVERGEHVTAAAVREVAEETGIDIRLGPPLRVQRYSTGARMKTVHYWVARAVGEDDVSRYLPNHEIDQVVWAPYDDAMQLLSYPYDRETLRESLTVRKKTRALVVLRHGEARSRRAWRGDDRQRPLLRVGTLQAERVVPVLAAYDVSLLISSSSTRCVDTLQPYADVTGRELQTYRWLSEEERTDTDVARLVDELLDAEDSAVVCTHRPVLPTLFDALGVDDVRLDPGGLFVVHHRKDRVVATERHQIR
ncbi:NUDIX hydrolase [Nocardioides speluncae]|uniref:NUDIX hydrolase n=1 Tax=Nocardioides speluncae TaxID=2670337 RepID=UPI000D68A4E6|nr:NUDIX domain-containing protein [Nocardioides speluncae]